MDTGERRSSIINMLKNADSAIPAKEVAAKFGVSRQVIVQDMAVIRASWPNIISTNRGYILQDEIGCSREFKVQHGEERLMEELNLIVDYGGTCKNVSISHKVYGRITADLDISSRQDVIEFVAQIRDCPSTMLGSATSGYHYHLVTAQSEERLDLIGEKLKEAGFLVPYLPWEMEK